MGIKSKFIEIYRRKTTLADNLLAIYGFPYSVVCLAMAITHKATVDHIISGIFIFATIGILSSTFIERDILKDDKGMVKFGYVLAFIMSAFCTLGMVALIWGKNGI